MNSTSQIRHLISSGAVKTTGGSQDIVPGQIAFVDKKKGTSSGLMVVGSFAPYKKSDPRFVLTLGEKNFTSSRTTVGHDSMSIPFSIDQVVEIGVSTPKISQPRVDEVRVGFDGHDITKSLKLKQGMEPLRINLKLEGGSIPYSGGNTNCEVIDLVYDFNKSNPYLSCSTVEDCEVIPCAPVVEDIVKQFKRRQIGGGRTLDEVVDIYPILSCNETDGNSNPFTTFEIRVCDTGDANALAKVQEGYNFPIKLYKREGSTSVYRALIPGTSAPSNYTPTTSGMLPNCDVCANGSSPVGGGYLYYLVVEDNGEDVTSELEAEFASSTVVKQGNSFGKGVYSLVVDDQYTWGDVTTAIENLATNENIIVTIDELGKTTSFCEGETLDPISWSLIETCYGKEKVFKLSLSDTECGEDRLKELQATYPDLNISMLADYEVEITLSGSSGTANLEINGETYLITFDTDLETTAADFVGSLSIDGISAQSVDNVITLTGSSTILEGVVINNDTGDLDGAVITTDITKGCMHTYQAIVPTNIVCDECDDAFLRMFEAESPSSYDGVHWEEVVSDVAPDPDCLCGIGFKGKVFKITPDKCFGNDLMYVEDSVYIEVGAAGYASDGFVTGQMSFEEEVAVTRISRKVSRDAVAGNLINIEKESGYYFQDRATNYSSNLKNRWVELESRFSDLDAQYLNYWIKIRHDHASGYLNQPISKDIIYNVYVEVGRQATLEALLNDLASARGISGVKAF